MAGNSAIKEQIQRELNHLPAESLAEIVHFIDYLKFKIGHMEGKGAKIVKLGGLWKDIPFDVTDKDIRTVREELARMMEHRVRELK